VRRLLTLGVAWVAAAIVATAVAWQGVGLVGDQVTDDRPASLTAAEVEAAVAAADASGDGGTTAASPTTAPPATTATTAPNQPAPVTRTYDLVGGSTALRFTPEGVTVVFATPEAGYQVRSEPRDDGGWRVEFDGPGGRSRVEGWWDGGPQDRVDSDGGSGSGTSGGGDDDGADDDSGPG
jgi:hypothetical protein